MKKSIVLMMALAMTMTSTVACNNGGNTSVDDGSIALKIWTAKEDQAMTQEMAEAFEQLHSEEKFKFEWKVMAEPDVAAALADMDVVADVFSFPGDQMYTMSDLDALYAVEDIGEYKFKTDAIANNSATSIAAGTVDDRLMAFPSTEDNTYFLYYDKSVVSNIENLDTILADCNTANKKFLMDLSNGFYNASFYFSNGGTLSRGENGEQVCDFNDPEIGIEATMAMDALALNKAFMTGDDSIIKSDEGIGSGIAAAVTGIWNAEAIKTMLGDNFGVMKLPDIKIGENYVPWKSFGGGKYTGVKANTAQPRWALEFASYITNEENQLKRFTDRGFAPSNTVVKTNETVTADPVVKAVLDQMAQSVSQKDALAAFWTPAEAVGVKLEDAEHVEPLTSDEIQELLDNMVSQMQTI